MPRQLHVRGASKDSVMSPPIPAFAFLIEKETTEGDTKRVLFDLGLRNVRLSSPLLCTQSLNAL